MTDILVMSMTPSYAPSPLTWGYTIGTTVTTVVPFRAERTQLWIHNPNATAKIAFCTTPNQANGNSLNPSIDGSGNGGAGSTILLPYSTISITGPHCVNSFLAVGSASGANITVWEFV